MKTQNEILQKLIELGYVELYKSSRSDRYRDADNNSSRVEDFNSDYAPDYLLILNALVSECGKREHILRFDNNTFLIFNLWNEETECVFEGDYTRQNIVKAFMRVVGFEI